MVHNNNIDEMFVNMKRDIEKLKEPVKDSTEVFDSIIVAEQLTVNITATLSDPVEVGIATVDTDRAGFCELES